MANKLNEGSEFTIPLKNLISLVVCTAVAVWAYFGIIERISILEQQTIALAGDVGKNEEWINNFQPPAAVQDTIKRVRELELTVKELETILGK